MGSPFDGPYSFKYHPWCREIHDCQSTYMTAKKSAQAGFTEVAINRALFTLDVLRRDVLYVLPTKTPDAADFSSARFGQAIKLSEYLGNLFTDTNKIELKQAGGVSLYIRGSNSESGLKSIPVSELILDEYDEMAEHSVLLALERLSGQLHKHVFALSTPTIPGVGIDALYRKSTQEHFFFKCTSCSRLIEFRWPDSFVLCGESITDPNVARSHYICTECKKELSHLEKCLYLADGIWEPTSDNSNDHRGFHINQMYSSTVSPTEIAIAHFRGESSEAATTEFMNSKMGEAYMASDAQVRETQIVEAIERSTNRVDDPRPTNSSQMITMGIDQGKWHFVVVCKWIYDRLGYDLNATAECIVLWAGEVAEDDFARFDSLMREWQVRHCVIDVQPYTNDARRFARRFPGCVTLCRYGSGISTKEITVPADDDSGAPIASVDRTNWMDAALGRFHTNKITLPKGITHKFREHICSPARRYELDKNGNPIAHYIETGPDHYAHALTYAEIALPFAASYATNRSISAFL